MSVFDWPSTTQYIYIYIYQTIQSNYQGCLDVAD